MRAALGVQDERLTPSELIRALLRAPVDLLFNGGIGTVVKASTETDADAQDRASDALRVDARDLRCRIVHSKERHTDAEPLHPFGPEAKRLWHDMHLIRFVAQRVLTTSSKPANWEQNASL